MREQMRADFPHFDGAKNVSGRKRHSLVDTLGFLPAVVVHAASTPDRRGGKGALQAAAGAFPRLQRIWADQGYTGTLARRATQEYGRQVQVPLTCLAPS